MKDLVSDANFECSPTALSLQAMDTSHVALVSMTLRSDGFSHYRCDRNISMGGTWTLRGLRYLVACHGKRGARVRNAVCLRAGMNMANMSKCLKCASNDDIITLKVDLLCCI